MCIEHGGYARQKAVIWWVKRFGHEPCRIEVIQDGRWQRVRAYDFTTKEGTPSEWNDDPAGRRKQNDAFEAGHFDVFDTDIDF